ncbi:glycosyltransferase family 1 protein [Peniophora sp. CONT]|nr:glycosyltransferase family 1 protein [Peniophora sp. CONT]
MPQIFVLLCSALLALLGIVAWRFIAVFSPSKMHSRLVPRKPGTTCSLTVFLGSGGHTSEMLALVSSLDFTRYTPRTYIVSEGDELSAQKAADLEKLRHNSIKPNENGSSYILTIPRARRVHQSLLTTPFSALKTLVGALNYMTVPALRHKPQDAPEVLLLNGPGTCFVLCVAALINRMLGLHSPRVIYVESFARVKSLSLSGRLLRPIVDSFIVQWPDALTSGKRGICYGWLV